MNAFSVTFFKDRQKFSAAHFTIFADGGVERLHGHNYAVTVACHGTALEGGLLFPFHHVKPVVAELCDAWDERVLLPTEADWVTLAQRGGQCEVRLATPLCSKFYSLPAEDVCLLPCNNISSENLALLFADELAARLAGKVSNLTEIEVAIGESAGQHVTVTKKV